MWGSIYGKNFLSIGSGREKIPKFLEASKWSQNKAILEETGLRDETYGHLASDQAKPDAIPTAWTFQECEPMIFSPVVLCWLT